MDEAGSGRRRPAPLSPQAAGKLHANKFFSSLCLLTRSQEAAVMRSRNSGTQPGPPRLRPWGSARRRIGRGRARFCRRLIPSLPVRLPLAPPTVRPAMAMGLLPLAQHRWRPPAPILFVSSPPLPSLLYTCSPGSIDALANTGCGGKSPGRSSKPQAEISQEERELRS